jgi:hypothetical protein
MVIRDHPVRLDHLVRLDHPGTQDNKEYKDCLGDLENRDNQDHQELMVLLDYKDHLDLLDHQVIFLDLLDPVVLQDYKGLVELLEI